MNKKKITRIKVRFLKDCELYDKGEECFLSFKEAEEEVENGFAEWIVPPKELIKRFEKEEEELKDVIAIGIEEPEDDVPFLSPNPTPEEIEEYKQYKLKKQQKEKEKKEFTKKEQEILFGENGLRRIFNKIKLILDEYMDLDDNSKTLIAIWIIGTYLHKQFSSYPYLYFNAMRGSGKSRVLKIIANLSKNGKIVGSMTEAVLFRQAYSSSLCIDEFENINSQGNENLKLLLNSAYKRGSVVERMKKRKEGYEIEEFPVFTPISVANISGMESVLSDRCVSIILEKSSVKKITRLIENFENNMDFKTIKGGLLRLTEKITDDLDIFGNIYEEWNSYIKDSVKGVYSVSSVSSVSSVKNSEDNEISKENVSHLSHLSHFHTLYEKVDKTQIDGRHLELFFPIFLISDILGEDILEKMLKFSKEIVEIKKERDREENEDVQFYEFLSQYSNPEDLKSFTDYITITKLTNQFREYVEDSGDWLNNTWVGVALRRLNLIIGKPKRVGTGRAVKIDFNKAQEKLLMFKEEPEKEENE